MGSPLIKRYITPQRSVCLLTAQQEVLGLVSSTIKSSDGHTCLMLSWSVHVHFEGSRNAEKAANLWLTHQLSCICFKGWSAEFLFHLSGLC